MGRGFCGGGSSSLHLIYFSGAQRPFGDAGGLEGGEEGFVGMDFVGEAFACGFLAVVGEIGHGKVLLELVHNTEIID